MRTTEVLQKALPESWGIDAIHRLVAAERKEGWAPDPLLRLEAILPPHRARIDALAERLRLSRAEAARLHRLGRRAGGRSRRCRRPSSRRRSIATGREGMRDRLRHALARELDQGHHGGGRKAAPPSRLCRSLDEAGLSRVAERIWSRAASTPGPEVGKRLKELEERWVESGFSLSREALLRA